MYNKLTSRKFWISLIAVITGVMGMLSVDENIVQIISSALMTLVPTVVYVITEGKIDCEDVKKIVYRAAESICEGEDRDDTNAIDTE